MRIFSLVLVAASAGCGIHLVQTRPPMALQGAPWTVPSPNQAAGILPLQTQCHQHIDDLRKDAEGALKAREARRIAVALTSAGLTATGLVLAGVSDSRTDATAISGYVVAGVGILTQAIDAVVPSDRTEALYAAWRRASDYFDAAELRLSTLNACTAFDDPLAEPECVGLDRKVEPSVPIGPMSLTPGEGSHDDQVRERFMKLRGIQALNAIKRAYEICAAASPIDFARKNN